MPKLPDPLRAELAETVERILAPDIDLRALVQEMNTATGTVRTRAWIGANPVRFLKVSDINNALLKAVNEYEPDLTLFTDETGSPIYMKRWWLRRKPADDGHGQEGLYVHLFENDDPVGLHNHPWASASLLLRGGPIFEDTQDGTARIESRQIVVRPAEHRHRIRLQKKRVPHTGAEVPVPAVTLFCTGKRVQEWGFEQPDGSIKPVTSTTGQVPRRGEANTVPDSPGVATSHSKE